MFLRSMFSNSVCSFFCAVALIHFRRFIVVLAQGARSFVTADIASPKRILRGLVFCLLTVLVLSIPEVQAQTATTIDGWRVTYLGASVVSGDTKFTYRACPSGEGF